MGPSGVASFHNVEMLWVALSMRRQTLLGIADGRQLHILTVLLASGDGVVGSAGRVGDRGLCR